MSAAHWHLLFNHFPITGNCFLLVLILAALRWKDIRFQQLTLGMVILVAILTYISHATGPDALSAFAEPDGQTANIMGRHAEAATWTLGSALLGGLLAALGLYKPRTLSWLLPALLCLVLATSALAGWTSLLGGMIVHTEIRGDGSAKTALEFKLPG